MQLKEARLSIAEGAENAEGRRGMNETRSPNGEVIHDFDLCAPLRPLRPLR
jgi:hypothetical protein